MSPTGEGVPTAKIRPGGRKFSCRLKNKREDGRDPKTYKSCRISFTGRAGKNGQFHPKPLIRIRNVKGTRRQGRETPREKRVETNTKDRPWGLNTSPIKRKGQREQGFTINTTHESHQRPPKKIEKGRRPIQGAEIKPCRHMVNGRNLATGENQGGKIFNLTLKTRSGEIVTQSPTMGSILGPKRTQLTKD